MAIRAGLVGIMVVEAKQLIADLEQLDFMLEESFEHEVWDELPDFEYAMAA